MRRPPEHDARALNHVYWLGGSPCAGKSSAADLLAAAHGLRLYRCDDAYDGHLARATPTAQPVMTEARARSWDEVWGRPLDRMVAEEFQFYREEFGLILDDVLALPTDRPLLAEGTALLPELVAPLIREPRRTAWVVPTEAFQRAHYPARGAWVAAILGRVRDPDAAFGRWMDRDARFARLVARRARARGRRVIVVDGHATVADLAAALARHFGFAPEDGG